MDKNIEYINQTIEIIQECLTKLQLLRDKIVIQQPEAEKMENIIKNIAEDVTQIKKGVIG